VETRNGRKSSQRKVRKGKKTKRKGKQRKNSQNFVNVVIKKSLKGRGWGKTKTWARAFIKVLTNDGLEG